MTRHTRPLTNSEVKAAKANDKPVTLYDGEALELLMKPGSNSKLWCFRYYRPISKKRAMISFGTFPLVSLADARRMRERARALLERDIDPQIHQQQLRDQERISSQNSFAKVAADWYELKKTEQLAPNTIKDIWRSLEKHVIPWIGNRPITSLVARDFITALDPIKASGKLEALKRVIQRINEVMDYAVNTGLILSNPAAKIRKAFQAPVKRICLPSGLKNFPI